MSHLKQYILVLNSKNEQCKVSKSPIRAIKTSINESTTQIYKMTFALDESYAIFKELTMQGVQNTCGYLASTIMPAALQTGALFVMIRTHESTPTSSMVLMNKLCILVFPKSIHRFQEQRSILGRYHEIDEWMACGIRPSIRNNVSF